MSIESTLWFILPGLLTEKLISAISVRREHNQFEGVAMGLVYTLVDVLVAWLLQWNHYMQVNNLGNLLDSFNHPALSKAANWLFSIRVEYPVFNVTLDAQDKLTINIGWTYIKMVEREGPSEFHGSEPVNKSLPKPGDRIPINNFIPNPPAPQAPADPPTPTVSDSASDSGSGQSSDD